MTEIMTENKSELLQFCLYLLLMHVNGDRLQNILRNAFLFCLRFHKNTEVDDCIVGQSHFIEHQGCF